MAHKEKQDCCDQFTPEVLGRLVEAKFSALTQQFSEQTGFNVEDVANTISAMKKVNEELKSIKGWKENQKVQEGN